jgi:hypothetical protein
LGVKQESPVGPVYEVFRAECFKPAKWRTFASPHIATSVTGSVQVENPVKTGYFAIVRVNCRRNRIKPRNLKAVGVKIDQG